jgi:hypothetical protein
MNAAATTLRPLTPAETRAVELHDLGVPTAAITTQTRLTADQIGVALARHAEWDALRNGTAKRGPNKMPRKSITPPIASGPLADDDCDEILPRPVDTPEPDPVWLALLAEDAPAAHDERPEIVIELKPVDWDEQLPDTPGEGLVPAEPEPAAVDWDAALAEEDGSHADALTPPPAPAPSVEVLLVRAQTSPQPRVRQLVRSVREQLAELESLLGQDEQVRQLTATREALRRDLAQTEAELAALLALPDAVEYAAVNTPEPEPNVPADEPDEPTTSDAEDDNALAYSREVREWARGQGWEVANQGRIGGAIVIAFKAAHPARFAIRES